MNHLNRSGQARVYAVTTYSGGEKVRLTTVPLNSYDNELDHFWFTFVAALSTWNLQFSHQIRQTGFPATPADRERFIVRLADQTTQHHLLLMVNHYNVITNPIIRQFFDLLTTVDNLELLLLYLESPELPPAFNHFRSLSLAEEAIHYRQAGLTLTSSECEQIRQFTDGWQAAADIIIQLFRQHGNALFSDLERYLTAWLENDFLSEYTTYDLHRLISLSMLDEFPLELLQHLNKWSGEALPSILENSPILRFNQNTQCFHFAPYCQQAFKQKLSLLGNSQRKAFYLDVADWHYTCGRMVEAIRYYRAANAENKILSIIHEWSFPVSRDLASCYLDAIDSLSPTTMEKQPLLYVIKGYMLSALYRYEEAVTILEAFCSTYDQGGDTPAELTPALGEAYTVLANAHINAGNPLSQSVPLYSRAAQLLPHGSAMVRGKINYYADCPVIRLFSPEPGSIGQHQQELSLIEPYIMKITNGGWAGSSYLYTAEYHYHTRQFKEVEGNARKAIIRALGHQQYDIVCSAYFLLMRLFFAKGNYKKTVASLDALRQYASEASYDTFFPMPDLAESWFYLKLQEKHLVSDWLKRDPHPHERRAPWNYGRDSVVYGSYLLLNQQYEELLAYTASSVELMNMRHYHLINIYLLMLRGICFHALGDSNQCADTLEQVYNWCHGNNLIMPVAEFGNHTGPVIETYRRTGRTHIPESWLEDMAKKSVTQYVYQYNIRKEHNQQNSSVSIIERLTEPERKLLLLICRGMKAREIAAMQDKSLSTVKGMIRRVYGKLGAANMADAVRIATDQNIEELVKL